MRRHAKSSWALASWILLATFFCAIDSVHADVSLPAILSDNMVLQQGKAIPIWGKADAGEKVTVTWNGKSETADAGPDGKWIVKIKTKKGQGPADLTVAGKNILTVHNVLVGEVWVCSGQSNMQMSVKSSNNSDAEIAAAKDPMLRLFTVPDKVADQPKDDVKGSWTECTPETVPNFSAVAYFFGRELRKTLSVPVGLIHTSWGGTPAESWTSDAALKSEPELQPILENWSKKVADYPEAKKKYDEDLAKWKEEADKAKAEGKPEPGKRPAEPQGPGNSWQPSGLYNAMIAPLIPFGIKGAIWYQGESNAGRAYQYRKLFATMITDWRKAWGEGDFPFFFVQLANFMDQKPEPGDSAWAELREAQSMALSLPNTGQAVIIDIGEAKDIHPKNKQDVGRRLALAALRTAYGQKLVYSGPTYDSMKVKDNKVRLHFKNVGGGLVAKDGQPLKGFAVAGEDKKFSWAQATIDGSDVIVESDKVTAPVAVRYAWADNPEATLYNKEGLPASPFRTDDWPGTTINNH